MSYTPTRDPDGRVPIARALRIFEQFEHSKQFWGAMAATAWWATRQTSFTRFRTSAL